MIPKHSVYHDENMYNAYGTCILQKYMKYLRRPEKLLYPPNIFHVKESYFFVVQSSTVPESKLSYTFHYRRNHVSRKWLTLDVPDNRRVPVAETVAATAASS